MYLAINSGDDDRAQSHAEHEAGVEVLVEDQGLKQGCDHQQCSVHVTTPLVLILVLGEHDQVSEKAAKHRLVGFVWVFFFLAKNSLSSFFLKLLIKHRPHGPLGISPLLGKFGHFPLGMPAATVMLPSV